MLKRYGYKIIKYQTITPNLWTILQIRHFFYNKKIGKLNSIWQVKKTNLLEPKINTLKIKLNKFFLKLLLLSFICFFNRLIDFFKVGDSLMIEAKINK